MEKQFRHNSVEEQFKEVQQTAGVVLGPSLDLCLAVKSLGDFSNTNDLLGALGSVRTDAVKLAATAMMIASKATKFETDLLNLMEVHYDKKTNTSV